MSRLIDKLRNLFTGRNRPAYTPPPTEIIAGPTAVATLNDHTIQRLMHLLEQTQEGMYSCEETFELLDEYVELVIHHQDAAHLMPYVRRHLDYCAHCHEAYEALLTILETKPDSLSAA